MKLSELKELLSQDWDWTDNFLMECLKEYLVKVNSGEALPNDKDFEEYYNYRFQEATFAYIILVDGKQIYQSCSYEDQLDAIRDGIADAQERLSKGEHAEYDVIMTY